MQLTVDEEFRKLAEEIAAWMDTEPDWRECESDDMFQSEQYCGGYDADEEAFTFSHYDGGGEEWWFQLTPSQVIDAARGRLSTVDARQPD